jgi:hypothetical protein
LAGGVASVHPFTGEPALVLLIDFDFDRAQAKIVPTGQILVIPHEPRVAVAPRRTWFPDGTLCSSPALEAVPAA